MRDKRPDRFSSHLVLPFPAPGDSNKPNRRGGLRHSRPIRYRSGGEIEAGTTPLSLSEPAIRPGIEPH